MQTALRLGFATAATDTGHSAADGPEGMFALGHPEKIVDFAYRAVHETTVKSKELIKAFYDRSPQYSYFKGCSTGGRQAVMAAQRYPEDYDGIIAGALANRHIQMHTAGSARRINLARNPDQAIPEAKAKMVTAAVMNKCDTLEEGFLNNPRQCTFNFATLLCKGADGDTCLTKPQLQAVETYYGGLKNSKGELIFSGQALGNPLPALQSNSNIHRQRHREDWGFQNANYDWRTFDLDRDMPLINQKIGFVDAVDPDLRAFKARGGKLLLYAGWGDTTITPENTVLYYENVLAKMGKDQGDFTRLFMVPGMGHCRGGAGPFSFDTIGTLEAVARAGQGAGADHGNEPAVGPGPPAVPVSAVCEVRRNRRPERRRQLGVHRSIGTNRTQSPQRSQRTCNDELEYGARSLLSMPTLEIRFSVSFVVVSVFRPDS